MSSVVGPSRIAHMKGTTMTQTVNLFAPIANTLAANAIAFKDASKAADNASTPFARSVLAAIVGGVSTLAFAESVVIGAFGSPLSPATGKPVNKVSGLRNVEGGSRVYQAWKDVAYIVDNLDTDAAKEVTGPTGPVSVGNGAIRAAVIAFILSDAGAKTALFGATGLTAHVKALIAEHGKDVATAMGVQQETPNKGEENKGEAAPTQSLTDRVNALIVALNEADDAAWGEALVSLSALSDLIDARTSIAMDEVEPKEEMAEAA